LGFQGYKGIKENERNTIIDVHCYATNTHPFNSVYKPDMVVDKKNHRKRKIKGTNINCRCTELLKLEDVGILVYEFNLTKRGNLRFRTMDILKKLTPEESMLRWKFVEPCHRSRRLFKPEMVGMNVDSNGALVDEGE